MSPNDIAFYDNAVYEDLAPGLGSQEFGSGAYTLDMYVYLHFVYSLF